MGMPTFLAFLLLFLSIPLFMCPFRHLGTHPPLDRDSASRFSGNVPGKRLECTVEKLANGRVELGSCLLVRNQLQGEITVSAVPTMNDTGCIRRTGSLEDPLLSHRTSHLHPHHFDHHVHLFRHVHHDP
jgi:hypothetical protein